MKSTFTDWVRRDEAVAFPDGDWLSNNWLTCFVTESVGLVLAEPTIPSACGPSLNLGSKLECVALGMIS